MPDLDVRFREAVQRFWDARAAQKQKQVDAGRIDAGTRGSVTGGTQMGALEVLVADILVDAGLDRAHVYTRTAIELPGYFRPEKKWDLLVVSEGHLVTAIEFKSQVGPSFGNNFNNRVEEAIGNATDLWTAYREGRFGTAVRPFLGYLFLLEDALAVHTPVSNREPYFAVDDAFRGASYARRYELLCRRMVLERLYDAAYLTLTTNASPTVVTHPVPDLSFTRFVADLRAQAQRVVASQ